MTRHGITASFLMLLATTLTAAEHKENYEAAGIRLAIAANCRANYGDHELFEVAFSQFEIAAQTSPQDFTKSQMSELKNEFYQIEADEGDNPFLRGACQNLRDLLIVNKTTDQ